MKYNLRLVVGSAVALIILLLIPPIYVCVSYWVVIASKFEPYAFVSDYLTFLGSLIALVLGFVLVNLYWERKLELDRANSLRRLWLSLLENIGKIAWDTGFITDRHVTTREEAMARDQAVIANLNRFGDVKTSIDLLADEITTTRDEKLVGELAIFARDIAPRLVRLSMLKSYGLGDNELKEDLIFVGRNVNNMILRLRGGET